MTVVSFVTFIGIVDLGVQPQAQARVRRGGERAVRAARRCRYAPAATPREGTSVMSDFTSGFWNLYVIALVVASHRRLRDRCWWCTGRIKVAASKKGAKDATGQAGRWASPATSGTATCRSTTIRCPSGGRTSSGSRWSSPSSTSCSIRASAPSPACSAGRRRARTRRSATEFDDRLKPLYAKYAQMDVEAIATDRAARQTGERMFLTYCAQCHGSDAGGSRGFPNLRDGDWLYGGAAGDDRRDDHRRPDGRDARLRPRARRGRREATSPRTCGRCRASRTTACARSSASRCSRRTALPAMAPTARATRRSARPTSPTHLALRQLRDGDRRRHRQGPQRQRVAGGATAMPSFEGTLSPTQIRVLAAYVWGLSNGAPAP